MMAEIPDRLYIDKKDVNLYKECEIFKDKSNREQLLFAMAIGFKNSVKHPLERKEGFVRTEYLKPEDFALLNAVAMYDAKTPEILANKEEVFKIAEEYAHAGIKLLYEKIKSLQYGSFYKQFEKELFEIYNELGVGEGND